MRFTLPIWLLLCSIISFTQAEFDLDPVDNATYGPLCPPDMLGKMTCVPNTDNQYVMCLEDGTIDVRIMDPGWECKGGVTLFVNNISSTLPVEFVRVATTTSSMPVKRAETTVETLTAARTLPTSSILGEHDLDPVNTVLYDNLCSPDLKGKVRCDVLFPDTYNICLGDGKVIVRQMDPGWICEGGEVSTVSGVASTSPIHLMRVAVTTDGLTMDMSASTSNPTLAASPLSTSATSASTLPVSSSLPQNNTIPYGDYDTVCQKVSPYGEVCDPWDPEKFVVCNGVKGDVSSPRPGLACEGGPVLEDDGTAVAWLGSFTWVPMTATLSTMSAVPSNPQISSAASEDNGTESTASIDSIMSEYLSVISILNASQPLAGETSMTSVSGSAGIWSNSTTSAAPFSSAIAITSPTPSSVSEPPVQSPVQRLPRSCHN